MGLQLRVWLHSALTFLPAPPSLAVDKGYKLDNEKNFLFRGSQKGERYCHD